MSLTKVLITVKTYPSISTKYKELVCTAGFREDGSWIRIYPIQFRRMPYNEQYAKYQWIELDLVKNTKDFRPESFRPVSSDTPINILGSIKADGDTWAERRKCVLNKVYTDMSLLISDARNKSICTSLAVFKPTEIIDFKWKKVAREWPKEKLEQFRQVCLFESAGEKGLEIVKKLPYKFSFVYKDSNGNQSTTMIEDWELGVLYWKSYKRHGDEQKACEDVRKKYLDDFARTKDLHFFMGTSLAHHNRSKNPFIIIGAFYPKPITQYELF